MKTGSWGASAEETKQERGRGVPWWNTQEKKKRCGEVNVPNSKTGGKARKDKERGKTKGNSAHREKNRTPILNLRQRKKCSPSRVNLKQRWGGVTEPRKKKTLRKKKPGGDLPRYKSVTTGWGGFYTKRPYRGGEVTP